jgi:hypothetical protein
LHYILAERPVVASQWMSGLDKLITVSLQPGDFFQLAIFQTTNYQGLLIRKPLK